MNPSTASNRLVKDILYKLIVDTRQNKCFRCNEDMTRDSFSIEHKVPWLDSDDPSVLYFDLENISFSHKNCNSKAARPGRKKYFTEEEKRAAKKAHNKKWVVTKRTPEVRRQEYLRSKSK